jgi:hypothetical protein
MVKLFHYLEMKGLWYLAVFSPAIRYSSDRKKSEAVAPVGFRNEGSAPWNATNENCFSQLAPVEVLPCSNEVSRTFGKA